jgi:hypothetical protein
MMCLTTKMNSSLFRFFQLLNSWDSSKYKLAAKEACMCYNVEIHLCRLII